MKSSPAGIEEKDENIYNTTNQNNHTRKIQKIKQKIISADQNYDGVLEDF